MAQEALSQTNTLGTLVKPEPEASNPASSNDGPSLGIPQNSETSDSPNRDLWSEAIDRFRRNVDSKTFAQIVEVHSFEELLKASSDHRDRYQSKKLPRMISWTMPFLHHLRSFCSVIDTMVQSNPTIAALVWGSLKLILEIIVRSADILSKVLTMFEQLCDDLPRYKRYALLFPTSIDLEKALLKMYMEIISFCSQLVNYFTRSPIRNILRAALHFFEGDFGQTLERVRRHNARVDAEALTASMELDKSRFEKLQKHFDQASNFSRVRLPCHMRPFGKNKRLFGRSPQLQKMTSLAVGNLEKIQKVIVIQGLGGVGKSEVALKFMHDHITDFAAIFWISAEVEGKIAQSYCDIARRLGLDHGDFQSEQKRAFEAVTQWLSSTDVKWMIVFDNACDNGFTDLEAFWPQGKNGTIIITTRNTAASHHFAAAEAICLEPFEPAESALFLESMIANSSYTMPKYHDDKVIKIANLLGGLPLAISQMVGFLVESECPLGEFVALYSSYENIEALHSISTAGSTMFYQHTLSTVWAMSIAGLGHDATVMLDLIAFLDPDSIPNSIFQTLPKEKLPESLGFLPNGLKLRLAIRKLLSQCLVKTNADETTLSIHRLVQFNTLQLMGKERRKKAFEHSLHLLSQLFPLHPPYRLQMTSVRSQSETLVQHVLLLYSRYKEFGEEFGVPIEFANLLDSCSWYLFERGLYDTALTIFETAKDICKRHKHDQSITLANIYSTFGTIYRKCNNPTKGQELFELAIARRETAVAKGLMKNSNIRLADAYMHLGSALLSLNDISKSLEYHLRAIAIREQQIHCEPQILALSYINIGWAYWQDKQLDKASEVLEKSLQIMEDLQENESEQSGQPSWALKALGNVRIDQGRWEEAFILHQRAFDIQLRIWGASHDETGDLCHKLGIHSEHQGHVQNAISWFEQTLEVYESTDLEVKAAVCRTMYRLSKLLIVVGQQDKGSKMHEQAGQMRHDITGIPIDVSDNLEAYECLVPYWGR